MQCKAELDGSKPASSVPAALIKTDAVEKSFKCSHHGCDAAFTASAKLTKHMRTHTGIKPYGCGHPGCGAAFTKSSQLAKHRRSHEEHTPLPKQASHTGETHYVQIEKAILDGNVKKLGDLLAVSNHAQNIIVLACKHNNLTVLEFLLGKKIVKQSVAEQKLLIDDQDEIGHNAFYYAVRSGNAKLLETLINKWPGKYFATRHEELDEILSQAFEELMLKNVPLSGEMKYFVENKLINLRFFTKATDARWTKNMTIKNIKERMDMVIQNIFLLRSQYAATEKIDTKFLFIATFAAQNIHILKRFLKFSYDRLPWEEIEFFLISFISSYTKREEINLFCNSTLNSSKIFQYLLYFATGLQDLKKVLEEIDIQKLSIIPCFKRDEIVKKIIKKHPHYTELYKDYQQIRDNYSLKKINNYIDLALSVDAKKREEQLIITRVLQVIGEYLKNTLESPKLSSKTSELLLLSLPKNTRQVLIDLRNSLSHAFSLAMRTEIEENSSINFFTGVQNDVKTINAVISDIFVENKVKLLRTLLQKVVNSESLEELREVGEMVNNFEVVDMSYKKFCMGEHGKLEKIVKKISKTITDKTDYEKELFKQLELKIDSAKPQSSDDFGIKMAVATLKLLNDSINSDSNSIRGLKFFAGNALNNLPKELESNTLLGVADLALQIYGSASSRIQGANLDKLSRLMYEIIYNIETETGDLKWIGTFGGKLSESLVSNKPKKNGEKPYKTEDYSHHLEEKLQDLKAIFNENSSGELNNDFATFKNNNKLQAMVEMLVLDIMSILGISEKHLVNNLLYLDENTPVLTGKNLRNHLAHDNILISLLSADPWAAIFVNAKKLLSDIVLKSPMKLGKFVEDDLSKLKNKYAYNLITVTTQENMFSSLEAGNFEEFMSTLEKGADLNAKSINSATALHVAAQGPCLEAVKYLIDNNLSVHDKDTNGQIPLHIAAAHGRNNILEFLIKQAGVSVDEKDKKWKTPLHLAAENGHAEIIKILLKHTADTNIKDMAGFSPIHYAVKCNNIEATKMLMKKEKCVDANETMGGFTLLHVAAEKGYLELVHFLLQNNGNVNAKTDRGAIPLHAAALNGHLEVVKALILAGADVRSQAIDGVTPLHNAVETGREEIANYLMECGANTNAVDKAYFNTPLHFAAKDGREKIVQALLMNNSNPNATTFEGATPLQLAVQSGHLKVVATLLKHGVNIHSKDKNNNTSLHVAAFTGNKEIAELLINYKAEINNKASNNLIPLHVAAQHGNTDLVQLLISSKADVMAKDVFGRTPMHAAANNGNEEVIQLLINAQSEVNVRCNEGTTPLHEAAASGHKNAAMLLIKHNADINAKSNTGITPFQSAILHGKIAIVNLLIRNKVIVNTDWSTELLYAVQNGHTKIVNILFENGASIKKGKNKLSLCSAVNSNNREMVEVLLNHGANVNEDDCKPLSEAILAGNREMVEVLLKHNARIAKTGDNAPLLVAAFSGNTDIASALIKKGANVNSVAFHNTTPLLAASERGNEDMVKLLIMNGAKLNFRDDEGSTPLHISAPFGHDAVVDVLLAHGANINIKDNKNRTPLELAVAHGQLKVVRMLLRHKDADINRKGNNDLTLLQIASEKNHLHIVKCLVDAGCDINARNAHGSKPIHIASRDGCCDIVKFFLSKGLSVDDRGLANQTLLHYAASYGQLDMVNFLVEQGVDVNAADDLGVTPMHMAAQFGSKDVVDVLLRAGAVYNSVDKFNRTPLNMTSNKNISNFLTASGDLFESVKSNNIADVKKFVRAGACINVKNASSGTPLHFAAWKGHDEITMILLENKANANAVGSKGFTPLHYAAKFSHLKIVKYLLKHGAVYNSTSDSGKTALDLTEENDIASLLKLINESFRKVQLKKEHVISDLNKLKDIETMAAVMGARNKEDQSLIAAALQSHFSKVEQLMEVMQGNVSEEVDRAMLLCTQGAHQDSLSILQNLLDKRTAVLGPDNPGTLALQLNIAQVLYKQGGYHKALRILNEIVKKQTQILGLDHKDTLNTRSTIALVYYRLNRNDEAYAIFQEVFPKQKQILEPGDSEILNTQLHMGLVLDRLGKYDEALKMNREVFEIRKKTLGPLNPTTISAQNNIALVLTNQNKCEEALQIYLEVLEKKKLVLGIANADTLRTLHNIAGIYMKQNNYQETLKIFTEVLNIQKQCLPQNHPETLNTRYNIGNAYFNQGKYLNALKEYSEVYDLRKTFFGPFDITVVDIERKIEAINLTLKCTGTSVSEVLTNLQKEINYAASDGDVQTLKRLLDGGADVNEADIEGRTPLHFAVSNGHIESIMMLLDNGASVTHVTNKGNTALHSATAKGNGQVVEILLQHVSRKQLNEFVNAKTTSGGTTCLHVAAKAGSVEIVKNLLRCGAIYCVENKEGKKPVDVCQDFQIKKLLMFLDILFEDVNDGNAQVVNKLKALQPDELLPISNARNSQGKTLLQVAIAYKHKNITGPFLKLFKE